MWIAIWIDTDEPIAHKGNIGVYVPLWDNPISAREWAQAQSKRSEYYIREVDLVYMLGQS